MPHRQIEVIFITLHTFWDSQAVLLQIHTMLWKTVNELLYKLQKLQCSNVLVFVDGGHVFPYNCNERVDTLTGLVWLGLTSPQQYFSHYGDEREKVLDKRNPDAIP